MNFGAVITYLLIMLFMFIAGTTLGQNICGSDICVVQFNASWNESNGVDYLGKLTDCEVMNISIDEGTYQSDYKIVVVPTIGPGSWQQGSGYVEGVESKLTQNPEGSYTRTQIESEPAYLTRACKK